MRSKNEGGLNQGEVSKFDSIRWLLVLIIVIAGLVANSYYSQVAWSLRAAVGIVLVAIAIFIASQTAQGQRAWTFMKGARLELRKVVWPSRQETIRTTMVVIGMVALTAVILWGFDTVFLLFISWITG